jgi:hypothetical protein
MFSYLVSHGSEVHNKKDEPAHPGAAVLPEERPDQERTYTYISNGQSFGSAIVQCGFGTWQLEVNFEIS